MILIAAVDQNWAIGRDGALLASIGPDLARFRGLTLGKTVILGRKTLATFPGGKPLEGRENLILSADPRFVVEGARVFRSLDDLLACAPADSVVVGGGSVYRALLPYCDTAYITKLHAAYPADTWLPSLDDHPRWRLVEEGPIQTWGGISFQYLTYKQGPEGV